MGRIWAQELVVQTLWQLEILNVQPHFIPFFKIHLSSGLVRKVLVPFMRLLKIGLGHFPQVSPFFIKLCDHGYFLTRTLGGCLTQVVGTIGDVPVTI
jgi:hypothetical protein